MPVEAASIRAFLEAGRKTTQAMRTVTFPWQRRVEMAVAWAFPFSLLAMLVYFFRPADVFPLVGLIWGMSFLIFLAFPLYAKWIRTDRTHVGFVLFDFGERAIPLVLWLLFMLGMVGYAFLSNTFSPMMIFRWGLISLVVLLLLSLDLTGSTPFYKSGLHKERLLRIDLDPKLCKGAGSCEQVCPTNVFEMDHARHLVRLPRADQCVQCGACIVQCPFDALCFRSPEGSVVTPATIRKFKLNLLGNRLRPKEVADAKSR